MILVVWQQPDVLPVCLKKVVCTRTHLLRRSCSIFKAEKLSRLVRAASFADKRRQVGTVVMGGGDQNEAANQDPHHVVLENEAANQEAAKKSAW